MRTLITGGILLTPDQRLEGHTLILESGRVAGIQPDFTGEARAEDHQIDARGLWVVPGFIDLHVHGGGGWDTMDASRDAAVGLSQFLARHGVTAYLPTTLSAPEPEIRRVLDFAGRNGRSLEGARPIGLHLEGPYLNPEWAGAQPETALRQPDRAEYEPWFTCGQVRMITLAPELPGAGRLIESACRHGVIPAAGHTAAGHERMLAAAELGLRQVSHLFNGMPAIHHRRPGPAAAALLDDRMIVHLIADGVHVHPTMVELVLRLKGPAQTVLISDAMRAAGMADGTYALGDQDIEVVGGVARTASGTLAGSTLTLDRALRNVMAFAGLTLQQALPMVTRTPAQALGGETRRGVLREGTPADITLLDERLTVAGTLVGGELIYLREDLSPATKNL